MPADTPVAAQLIIGRTAAVKTKIHCGKSLGGMKYEYKTK